MPGGKNFAAAMKAPHASRVIATGAMIGRRSRKISDKLATRTTNKCDPEAWPSKMVKLTIAMMRIPRKYAPASLSDHRINSRVTGHKAAFNRFKPIAAA